MWSTVYGLYCSFDGSQSNVLNAFLLTLKQVLCLMFNYAARVVSRRKVIVPLDYYIYLMKWVYCV